MAEPLTPRERFLAALGGARVRPVPVGAVTQPATLALMQSSGAAWPHAHRDAEAMAALAAAAQTEFGFDCVRVPFDQTIEAESLGCEVAYGEAGKAPAVQSHAHTLDASPPPLPDICEGRAAVVAAALKQLKSEIGSANKAAVLGGIVGPFTLVCQLAGVSNVLMAALRQPELVRPWLAFAVRVGVDYARLQVRSGADAICVEDMSASLDLTSPGIYRSLILPAQQELIQTIAAPVVLHVCGNNTKIIDLLLQTGAAALSLEDRTDLAQAAAGPCAIIGGVSPVEVLLNGAVQDVCRASRACLAAGVHVLAPGCGLVPETPTHNVREMVRAARAWDTDNRRMGHG